MIEIQSKRMLELTVIDLETWGTTGLFIEFRPCHTIRQSLELVLLLLFTVAQLLLANT
jgi:hypothetical protein